MIKIKKTLVGLGLGATLVLGSASFAVADNIDNTQQRIVIGQESYSQKDVSDSARKQVEKMNDLLDLDMTEKQKLKIVISMTNFIEKQYTGDSTDLKEAAIKYQETINNTLTEEQKMIIAKEIDNVSSDN